MSLAVSGTPHIALVNSRNFDANNVNAIKDFERPRVPQGVY